MVQKKQHDKKREFMHITKVHIENFKCFKGSFRFKVNEGINIFVGNNEAGKSSIIEAIHLALSGLFNGKYLRNELTQYVFNNEIVSEYISKLEAVTGIPIPPHILIEIFIEGDDLAELEGINNSERTTLFDVKPIYYLVERENTPVFQSSLPKISSLMEESILRKIKQFKTVAQQQSLNASQHIIYYTRKVSFFLQFLDFIPTVKGSDGKNRDPSELKTIHLPNDHLKNVILSGFSSSIFYWFYIINSDCRNLNKREIINFSVPEVPETEKSHFKSFVKSLMKDYIANSTLRTVTYKDKGAITVQYFNFRLSKPIIDEIDKALASHYGFTDNELDFIINYDIKYRMGKELEEED